MSWLSFVSPFLKDLLLEDPMQLWPRSYLPLFDFLMCCGFFLPLGQAFLIPHSLRPKGYFLFLASPTFLLHLKIQTFFLILTLVGWVLLAFMGLAP